MKDESRDSIILGSEFVKHLLAISEKRSEIISRMKKALIAQDFEKVINLSKILTGLEKDESCKPT